MGLLSGRHSNDPVGSTTTGHHKHTLGNNVVGGHRYETRSRGLFGGRSPGPGTATGIGFGRKNKHNNAPVANPAPTHSAGVTAAQPNTAVPRSNVSTSPLQLRC